MEDSLLNPNKISLYSNIGYSTWVKFITDFLPFRKIKICLFLSLGNISQKT